MKTSKTLSQNERAKEVHHAPQKRASALHSVWYSTYLCLITMANQFQQLKLCRCCSQELLHFAKCSYISLYKTLQSKVFQLF